MSYYSSKKRKEYLVLTCGPPSVSTSVPTGKGEDGESSSDDESSGDEENQTVSSHGMLFLISEIFCFRAFPGDYLFRDKYNSHVWKVTYDLILGPYFTGEEFHLVYRHRASLGIYKSESLF